METLLLTPGGLLITLLLLILLLSSVQRLGQPRTTVIYVPIETRPEPSSTGCLPLLVLLGIIFAALMGTF
jgi:hypothetical protein